MSDSSSSPSADKLDQLLASRPVSTRVHFAERVQARLHEDPAAEAADLWIDHLLTHQAVRARDDFAAQVRARLSSGEGRLTTRKVSGSLWRSLIPFAAVAALLFAVFSLSTDPTEEFGPVLAMAEQGNSGFNPSVVPSLTKGFQRDSAETASLQSFGPTSPLPAMAASGYDDVTTVLVLASGLGLEARALLERPDIHSWLALAE